MSNKTQKDQEKGAEVVGNIQKAEAFFNKNKNILLYTIGGILLVLVVYFCYREFILKPRNNEAAEKLFIPQNYFEKDSFRIALIGNGSLEPGFEAIANDYSSTPSGNLAKFYAGVCCLHIGEYQEAIAYLKRFKSKDEIFAARALANIGDSYAQLGELNDAANYFEQAGHKKDNDYSPSYLMKASAVYEKLGKYDSALKLYDEIKTKYPLSTEANTIDKYIERAKLSIK